VTERLHNLEPILTSREKAGAVSGEFHHCHLKGTLGLFGQKNKVYFGVGIHIDIYMYMYTYIYDDMYIAIYIYTASRISCNQCIDGHITDGHDGLATWSPKSSQGFHSIPSWSVEKSAFE